MSTTVFAPSGLASRGYAVRAASRTAGVSWELWSGTAAVLSSVLGMEWDVAWHRSIGRDTFWTPAHVMIQLCGVITAVVCGYLVVRATFGNSPELRGRAVQVFGVRAPLGCFLAVWGGLAMLVSAPFDNWWHAAYGLDVKIISPPHVLLILGIRAVSMGMLFLILAAMNRAALAGTADFTRLRALFLYLGGIAVGGQMFFLQEYTWDIKLHQAAVYIAMAIGLPVLLASIAQASRFRWAATSAAAVYTLFVLAQIAIFPLIPAQPKLGPVFNPITHLVPTKFPILILIPALALDLLWHYAATRTTIWKRRHLALASGILFVAVLAVVEWPFATFLLSHASENRFFGTIYFDYAARPDGYDRLRHFLAPENGLPLTIGLIIACACATASTWIGLTFGRWMRTVQR